MRRFLYGAVIPAASVIGVFADTTARADIAPGTNLASAQVVETETDRCGGKAVHIISGTHINGPFELTNNNEVVEYAISSQDVYWTCDGSKERTKCPATANAIRVRRGANRLLSTQCLLYTPPAPPPPKSGPGSVDVSGARLLSTETDRCGRPIVRLSVGTHVSGPTALVNGSHDEMTYAVMTPEIYWTCEEGHDVSNERTRCPNGTNLVKVSRGADRLLTTKCMQLPEHVVPSTQADFREKRGYSFVNSDKFQNMVGGYTFDDLTEIYGKCETHIFGCAIPDPMALALLGIMNATLKDGQCFGFSVSSLRMGNGDMPFAAFPSFAGTDENKPGAPTDLWHLVGPSFTNGRNVSPKLAHYIHLNHMLQFSSETLHTYIGETLSLKTPAGLKSIALESLKSGGGVVSVNKGTAGHAMALYRVENLPNGAFGLDVYNPNVPWDSSEATNATTHADALNKSRLVVTADGHFSLPGSEFMNRPMTSIAVLPYSIYRGQQHLPSSIQGLGSLIFGGFTSDRDGVVAHTQVTDAHGHTLLLADGTENTDPRTRIPGSALIVPFGGLKPGAPLFLLDSKGTYTHTVTGKGQGNYDAHFVGPHFSVELHGVPARAGESDTVVLDAAGAGFEMKTGAAQKTFQAKMHARAADGSVRTVTLQGTGFKDAPIRVAFDAARQTIVYTHAGGPATITFGLAATHQGGAHDVTGTPIAVEHGDTITLKPVWTQLHVAPGSLTHKKKTGGETTRAIK
jgi:hypothetical protein